MAIRITRDWLLLTNLEQTLMELETGSEKYIQDIIISDTTKAGGENVEIFIEKKSESTLDKPSFDPTLSTDFKTQGLFKGGLKLHGDEKIVVKLTGVVADVYIRTLF